MKSLFISFVFSLFSVVAFARGNMSYHYGPGVTPKYLGNGVYAGGASSYRYHGGSVGINLGLSHDSLLPGLSYSPGFGSQDPCGEATNTGIARVQALCFSHDTRARDCVVKRVLPQLDSVMCIVTVYVQAVH